MEFQISSRRKTAKQIPESSRLEFLENFSVNNFAFSDAESNISRLLNRGGIADLPLFRTLLAICQVSRAKFLESDRLFCFINICKVDSFRRPFAVITSLPELYFRFRRFIHLVEMKNVISMNYDRSTSC